MCECASVYSVCVCVCVCVSVLFMCGHHVCGVGMCVLWACVCCMCMCVFVCACVCVCVHVFVCREETVSLVQFHSSFVQCISSTQRRDEEQDSKKT